jgi:hypothetical protein
MEVRLHLNGAAATYTGAAATYRVASKSERFSGCHFLFEKMRKIQRIFKFYKGKKFPARLLTFLF